MTALPSGTVTFLFTDIEGSTNLARDLGESWPQVLADHNDVLRAAIRDHHGVEVGTQGDSFFAVFSSALDAVGAAAAAQRSLSGHSWPEVCTVGVRMGLHTGEGRLSDGEYIGLDVHRAARVAAAGHGGQVLLSDSTFTLLEDKLAEEVSVRDLGRHRLKDFEEPKHIYQLVIEGLPAEFQPLKSLNVPTNLPVQLTSFVGRESEAEEITKLVASSRLTTLTGPGGTGKTRLALRAASNLIDRFAQGVFFVELAAITDPQLVPDAVASTLGLGRKGGTPLMETIKNELRDRTTLLVLDNFEQVIEAAPMVGELLAACPRLTVLVTSRESLRIAGEQEFPVPPLQLPKAGEELDQLRNVDSVALFLHRARAIRPGFDLTRENSDAVAQICNRLDGLPLALELAAARTRLFEPKELLTRLDRRLSFLSGGRDLTQRQRTLRGAIDWSHDLLAEPEQMVFRRFSVFAGGCTLEGAEKVCESGESDVDVLEAITSLHEKSLLRRDEAAAGVLRVAMLETIREYARERLKEAGETTEVQRRHASFFTELAETAAPNLQGPDQQVSLQNLDAELDNFRAAIRWSIESGEAELGLRLAASLNRFWLVRNHGKEGRQYLDELLALPSSRDSLAVRAAAIDASGDLAVWQGDYEAGQLLAEQALAAYRELGDTMGVARQLNSMGYSAIIPDPAEALRLFKESIETYRQVPGSSPEIGQVLVGMALPTMQFGQLDEAREHLKEAEAIFESAGDETLSLVADGLLGMCDRLDDDLISAKRRYIDNLLRSRRVGSEISLTLPLSALADLALLEGHPEKAAILEAAQAQIAERLGGAPSFQLVGIEDVLERARADLGDERCDAAVARGRAMPVEEIVALALSSG